MDANSTSKLDNSIYNLLGDCLNSTAICHELFALRRPQTDVVILL